jgi:peptidoglycan-associated lipoprotein
MISKVSRLVIVSLGLMTIGLSGCSQYVKKTDYDAAIAQLRANDQKQQQQIDNLTQEMQQKFAKYDAQITQMAGRVRVDAIAHFAFNQSSLRDQDKPLLEDFAKTVGAHYPNAIVTVEGFADPAGSKAYNLKLGEKRAEAVRNYLVSTGGLSASQVRAVSYGKAKNRLVDPGKSGDQGGANRRVTLVVDFAGEQPAAS